MPNRLTTRRKYAHWPPQSLSPPPSQPPPWTNYSFISLVRAHTQRVARSRLCVHVSLSPGGCQTPTTTGWDAWPRGVVVVVVAAAAASRSLMSDCLCERARTGARLCVRLRRLSQSAAAARLTGGCVCVLKKADRREGWEDGGREIKASPTNRWGEDGWVSDWLTDWLSGERREM